MSNRTRTRGFTLIELLVALSIIGILSSMAIPLAELGIRRTKEEELKANLRELRKGIDRYKKAADENRIERPADASGFPPDLQSLAHGITDTTTPDKKQLYFLRRIPMDPFHSKRSENGTPRWGLRSYNSAPANPQAGDDVFDVYSLSEGVGLNGIPYRQW